MSYVAGRLQLGPAFSFTQRIRTTVTAYDKIGLEVELFRPSHGLLRYQVWEQDGTVAGCVINDQQSILLRPEGVSGLLSGPAEAGLKSFVAIAQAMGY